MLIEILHPSGVCRFEQVLISLAVIKRYNSSKYYLEWVSAVLVKSKRLFISCCSLLAMATHVTHANVNSKGLDPEDRSGAWSLGAGYAWQDSPYAGESWRTDFMPQFIYSGEKFYFDTTRLGWHFVDNEDWQVDGFVSYYLNGYNDHSFYSSTGEVRDEDDPLKGMERSSSFEAGGRVVYKTDLGRWSLTASHDINGTHNGGRAEAEWSKTFRWESLQIEPWLKLNSYSRETANYYFGVTNSEALPTRPEYAVDATYSYGAGAAIRYTVFEQHHLSLSAGYTVFSDEILDSPIVSERGVTSVAFNYRYQFDDSPQRYQSRYNGSEPYNFFTNNPNPWSYRVAYGCTSDTSLNKIVRLQINCDGDDTNLASLFVSRRVTETLLTLPIEGWVTTGVARRFESEYHPNFWEGVFAFKAIFRQFPWSDTVETRFGVAEGISYAQRVPNIETERAVERDRRTSKFLNYLDFSFDVSIGDLFGKESLDKCFVGFSVHHRSGIFAASNFYSNVYGGSNVNTLYVECERY